MNSFCSALFEAEAEKRTEIKSTEMCLALTCFLLNVPFSHDSVFLTQTRGSYPHCQTKLSFNKFTPLNCPPFKQAKYISLLHPPTSSQGKGSEKKKKKKMAKSVLLLFLPSSNSFDFHLRQVWMPHSLCLTALSAYSLLTGGCFQITTPGALFAIFTKVLLFGVTPSEVSIIRKTRRAAKISSSTGKASEPGLRGVAARRGAEAYLWGMPVAWALVCSPDSS